MAYELISIESEAAGKTHVLAGTVVDVDIRNNTVDISIDDYGTVQDIPVFYHCPNSETASGGMPYIKDDRAIIVNSGDAEDLNTENLRAVGFEDGLPRPCEFKFRITRDDGVIIDHTKLDYAHGILIYQQHRVAESKQLAGRAHGYYPDDEPEDATYWTHEDGTWYYERQTYYAGKPITDKFSYSTETQIWTVYFVDWEYVTPRRDKSFWATFLAEDSGARVEYSYPLTPDSHPRYIYNTDDFYQAPEKMLPGFYEVRIPYYKVTYTRQRTIPVDLPTPGYCSTIVQSTYGHCNENAYGAYQAVVESSLPYIANFIANGSPTIACYGWYLSPDCPGYTCAYCETYWAYNHWWNSELVDGYLIAIHRPAWFLLTTTNGDNSNNIETSPINSEQNVTPTPYTVSIQTHKIECNYNGPDPVNKSVICGYDVGPKNYPLDLRITRAIYRIDVSINV